MRMFRQASVMRALVALAALLAAAAVHAQAQNAGRNLNVMAVNANNGAIYSVTFAPPAGSTTIGNTDGSSYLLPTALAFVTNATTNQLDLLVADSVRGAIYRYPGALAQQTPPNPTTRSLVWNAWTAGSGPLVPVALAADGFGNLFVGNSLSLVSRAQLWEFPVGTSGSGSFAAPVLLDGNFEPLETPLEVALAPADVAGASGVAGGDLIVLTSARVLAYSKASGYTSRITLLAFPNGFAVPDGMDFWPVGNGAGANYSLLITNLVSGTISRYYLTNPLTAAPAPFATGLEALFRVKTVFQAGNPLVLASEAGAILEFAANPDGTGALLATVTQNVTLPRGLVVSNSFTNAASTCLQSGGCDLTGLVTHTLTGIATLSGNIVENVCTVSADPRVSISSGVWSCSVPYTPPAGFTCPPGTPANGPGCLPINAMCPGFDDTGTMALPDTLCGRSGSSGAGFSIIKTLVIPGQFAGGYVNNSMVLADGSNPLCGPGAAADGALVWAPLQAEGALLESPNMVDVSSGCGTGHGVSSGLSVFGVGVGVNELAPELNPSGGLLRPLENFAQSKYTELTTTIDDLTEVDPNHPRWTDAYPNIAASVSLGLWGGNVPPASNVDPFGCLDQSWALFYNATRVDTDSSPQWTADLQNAANALTQADATGNSTCAGIITYAQANTPNAFVQTPNSTYPNAPLELNPYGQLHSRIANLYYTINTRILGNPASALWPLPVSINVVPTAVTLAAGSAPASATLSWNTNGDSGCTLSSSDNTYQGAALSSPQSLTIPPGDAGTLVTYTVSCSSGPAASTVSAYVNVYPPPTLVLTQPAIPQGGGTALTWNTNHAGGCALSSPNDAAFVPPSAPLALTGSVAVGPKSAGSYAYNLSCTSPATTVTANLSVVAPPTLTLSAAAVVQGIGAMLNWNANGNTGCSWTSNDPGFAPNGTSGSVNVNPAAGSYTYTYACTGPAASSQSVSLTVVQQPTVTVSPSAVIQGSAATLTWSGSTSACSWASTDPSFVAPSVSTASGSSQVQPTAPGAFSYTLTCPAPTTPAVAALTVNAPAPPTISVSPSSIVLGSSASLTWTINKGDVCTGSSAGTDTNANDAFTSMKGATSGNMPLTPNATGTDTYSLNCTVPATTQSATLTVTAPLAKVSISIKPVYDLDIGDPGILTWSLSGGASGCVVSGTWPKYAVPQFSAFPVSSSGNKRVIWNTAGVYTYTLTCSNPSAPVQTSVTITKDR
jgi:hypothetical protein